MISLIRYLVPSGKEDGAARELREDDEDDDPVHVFGQVVDAVIRNGCVEARVMPGINSSPLDRWRQMKSSRQMQRVADERVAAAFSDTLPLADDLKRLSTARYLLNVQANILALGAVVLLGGEFALIAAMPDDNPVLLSVQVVTGLLAGGGAVILLATSFLVRGMSLAPAHDNGVELSTVVVEGAVVGECNGVYHPSPDDHPADGQPFYCNQHGATIGWSDASSPPPRWIPCDASWMTAADERAADERAADERAADECVLVERAVDERAADERAADERAADERAADERAADERAADAEKAETKATRKARVLAEGEAKTKWLRFYAHYWSRNESAIRGPASQWAVFPRLICRCSSDLIREVRKSQRITMTWRGLADAALHAESGVFSWQPDELFHRILSFMPPAQNPDESFAAAHTCRQHKMLTRVRLAALAARPEGAFWSILELVAELPPKAGRCARLPVAPHFKELSA